MTQSHTRRVCRVFEAHQLRMVGPEDPTHHTEYGGEEQIERPVRFCLQA
jgi:hypothetical protein